MDGFEFLSKHAVFHSDLDENWAGQFNHLHVALSDVQWLR